MSTPRQQADRLDVLIALVEAYEHTHYALPAPDPIEAIEHGMERKRPAPLLLRGGADHPVGGKAGHLLTETPHTTD